MNKATLALTLLALVPGTGRADTLESAFVSAVAAATSAAEDARAGAFSGLWILASKDFPEGVLMPGGLPAFTLVIVVPEKSVEFVSRSNIPGWMTDTNYPLTVKDGVAAFASHHHCTSRDEDDVACRLVDARRLRCDETDGAAVKSYDFVRRPL